MRPAGIAAFLAAVWTIPLPAQRPASQDSLSLVLGPSLAHQPELRFLRGEGWRDLWTDTLRLPVLRAGATSNGIFRDAEGRAWRVVPVDQSPVDFSLPANLQGGEVEQWLKDLTATMHPTAPLAASALYQAAGLSALRPRLVATPDGHGAWVERAAEVDGLPLAPFERVITSDTLLALLRREPMTGVDLHAFLKARLLDVLLGDRDRERHHWLWGLKSGGAGAIWVPIAIRQQQAFLRADISDRFLLGNYEAGFTAFGPGRPATRDLVETGYDFDRPLLARLERAVWDSTAAQLRSALTAAAIDQSLNALPPPHRQASAALLATTIESRRDRLDDVVRDFYDEVTRYADLELSDAAESVQVTRLESGDLEITVAAGGEVVLRRTFRRRETSEVRLHLRGGDDRVTLAGMDRHGVGVRITGGTGQDVVARTGKGIRRVVVYDLPDGVTMDPADAARLVPRPVERFRLRPDSGLAASNRDWGVGRSPVGAFDITGDLGLLVGGGMKWTWYGFDEPQYRQRATATLEYASRPNNFRAQASLERRDVLRNVHLTAGVRASGIEVIRFFGYGNETSFTQDMDYYRSESRELGLTLMAGFSRDPALEFRIGPALRIGSTDTTTTNLVGATQPYGSGRFNMAGLEAQFRYTPRRPRYQQGFAFQARANGRFYPKALDVTREVFGGVDGEVRLSWVPQPASRFTVAGRAGGSVLGGAVPFTMASRVGGPRSLRGWETSRFAGDRGSAYAGMDLRARLFRYRLGFIPGDFGALAFWDAGRVWTSGESSSRLHWGGGAGLWLAPTLGWIRNLDEMIGRLEFAWGGEHTIVSIGTGFRF